MIYRGLYHRYLADRLNIKVITPARGEHISLEQAKEHRRITADDQDASRPDD